MPPKTIERHPTKNRVSVPQELWMLFHETTGEWVISCDDAPNGPTYLCAIDYQEAVIAAKYQEDLYGIRVKPIRVL